MAGELCVESISLLCSSNPGIPMGSYGAMQAMPPTPSILANSLHGRKPSLINRSIKKLIDRFFPGPTYPQESQGIPMYVATFNTGPTTAGPAAQLIRPQVHLFLDLFFG